MAEARIERRLAAILAADVAGYSRLMGVDEEGTLAALKAYRRDLIDPKIAEHHGRIVKTTGDGVLVEFASAVDAVRCATEIQRIMAERNAAILEDRRIEFRIGINVGDIIVDDSDIYGDGVNVAARLEGIAEPGGVCISSQVYDQVEGKIPIKVRALGRQNLKNIAKPVNVFGISVGTDNQSPTAAMLEQEISYCRALDGVRLAWAKLGSGPPLVRAANWLHHLEYDWKNPVRRDGMLALAKGRTLIRYDARGNGLSDWDVDDISLDAWVGDLEAVVSAAGVDRFPLLGLSQGVAVSVAYAVRNPERLTHLILYGGFVRGGDLRSSQEKEQRAAMMTLMRIGWGGNDPTFRQLFTSRMMPGASKEQADAFNEAQRLTTSADCAARYFQTVGALDISDLAPKVKVPTLVMHSRGDLINPIDGSRKLTSLIPGARFVVLQSDNHMLLPGEAASARFLEEINLFLAT